MQAGWIDAEEEILKGGKAYGLKMDGDKELLLPYKKMSCF